MKCEICKQEKTPLFVWVNAPSLDNPKRRLKMMLCRDCVEDLVMKGVKVNAKKEEEQVAEEKGEDN